MPTDVGATVVAVSNVLLVFVTLVYVRLTYRISKAATEQADTAGEQADAARSQADAALDTLLHMQHPVLVFRMHDEVRDGKMPLQFQNVGEGATIWPRVKMEGSGTTNLLDPAPHIIPHRQFREDDTEVVQRQRFVLDAPEGDECVLLVICHDPRTGGDPSERWRIYTVGEGKWYAIPVRGDEG